MFSNVKLYRYWFKKIIAKKSVGYSHHSAKCSLYTSFRFRVLCAATAYWLQSPTAATRFFLFYFFSHYFCTALFLLNHILFITFDWIQYHFRQKKHTFATTSTQDDMFQVCYSRYQPIGATFRVTIYSNPNYTVYFRPVCYNILLFVYGLYLVCIFSFFGCHGLHSFNPFTTFFLVILCILL